MTGDDEDLPHVFVQWKGTDVCLDFWCECGQGGHFDSWNCYRIQCGACDRCYDLVASLRPAPTDVTAPAGSTIIVAPDPDLN